MTWINNLLIFIIFAHTLKKYGYFSYNKQMSEEQAFFMLRHLMFRRHLRAQYLPDMVMLQVQLYQLSRLIHDNHPDLYTHLDKYEVAPTLFAAPWILTIFASQFPLGFVTRVFGESCSSTHLRIIKVFFLDQEFSPFQTLCLS